MRAHLSPHHAPLIRGIRPVPLTPDRTYVHLVDEYVRRQAFLRSDQGVLQPLMPGNSCHYPPITNQCFEGSRSNEFHLFAIGCASSDLFSRVAPCLRAFSVPPSLPQTNQPAYCSPSVTFRPTICADKYTHLSRHAQTSTGPECGGPMLERKAGIKRRSDPHGNCAKARSQAPVETGLRGRPLPVAKGYLPTEAAAGLNAVTQVGAG